MEFGAFVFFVSVCIPVFAVALWVCMDSITELRAELAVANSRLAVAECEIDTLQATVTTMAGILSTLQSRPALELDANGHVRGVRIGDATIAHEPSPALMA